MLTQLTSYPTRRFPGPDGNAWVDILSTDQVREVRASLLNLAYRLMEHPDTNQAYCVVGAGKSTPDRLRQELDSFRAAVRDDLGGRIFVLDANLQPIDGSQPPFSLLNELAREVREAPTKRRLSRHSVVGYLVNAWLEGASSQGVSQLVKSTGASYQTVQAAFEELRSIGLVEADQYPRVVLRPPRWEDWQRLCKWREADRKSIRFNDPTGAAQSPAKLLKRLNSLAASGELGDVRVSGVFGANTINAKDLNISAAPRLDLCVLDNDTSFVAKLDPALESTEEWDAKPSLVIHLVRRTAADSVQRTRQVSTASPLDCVTDLFQIGYLEEAKEFAQGLARRATQLSV